MTPSRVALVTGSGKRRVGWHVAEALAARGFALAVHYRSSAAEAMETVEALRSRGVQAVALQADLTDLRSEVEQAVETYRVALATITADDPATLKAAKDVRDKTEEAWKAGGLKLLDLLDAQRAYRDRIRASISSQADYWRALNRLNAAIGVRTIGETLPAPSPVDEKAVPPKK